jgi:hypothetical protein
MFSWLEVWKCRELKKGHKRSINKERGRGRGREGREREGQREREKGGRERERGERGL